MSVVIVKEDDIVFLIALGELQQEAMTLLGRELKFDEVNSAKKMIQAGLVTDIETIFSAAIDEAVKIHHSSELS